MNEINIESGYDPLKLTENIREIVVRIVDNVEERKYYRFRKEWRRINGREFPAVLVDFKEWIDFYSIRGHQLNPLDSIALRYLKKSTSIEKAFRQLARDLVEFFKECGGEVEWGVEG